MEVQGERDSVSTFVHFTPDASTPVYISTHTESKGSVCVCVQSTLCVTMLRRHCNNYKHAVTVRRYHLFATSHQKETHTQRVRLHCTKTYVYRRVKRTSARKLLKCLLAPFFVRCAQLCVCSLSHANACAHAQCLLRVMPNRNWIDSDLYNILAVCGFIKLN